MSWPVVSLLQSRLSSVVPDRGEPRIRSVQSARWDSVKAPLRCVEGRVVHADVLELAFDGPHREIEMVRNLLH